MFEKNINVNVNWGRSGEGCRDCDRSCGSGCVYMCMNNCAAVMTIFLSRNISFEGFEEIAGSCSTDLKLKF